jgi:hypothetical protein
MKTGLNQPVQPETGQFADWFDPDYIARLDRG